jgi:hypothetical protein
MPGLDAKSWRDDRTQAINKTATLLVITFDSQIADLAAINGRRTGRWN